MGEFWLLQFVARSTPKGQQLNPIHTEQTRGEAAVLSQTGGRPEGDSAQRRCGKLALVGILLRTV
jgi:hypothetical protein